MTAAELAELAERQAVVAIGRRLTSPGVDVVRAADDVGVRLAVEHLAGLGHRPITFVEGPRGAITTLRRQGYRAAMRLAGMDEPRTLAGGDTEAAGPDATTAGAAAHGRLAFNDRCALGLLDRLRRDGLDVPGDVSVVGYDDSPWPACHRSTSPRSARRRTRWPRLPWPLQSSGSGARHSRRPTSCSSRTSWCARQHCPARPRP